MTPSAHRVLAFITFTPVSSFLFQHILDLLDLMISRFNIGHQFILLVSLSSLFMLVHFLPSFSHTFTHITRQANWSSASGYLKSLQRLNKGLTYDKPLTRTFRPYLVKMSAIQYSTVERGTKNTESFRIYFCKSCRRLYSICSTYQ